MSLLVGKAAPDFVAPAVLADGSIDDNLSFSKAIKGKYALLFFYPLNFTFVCPTELIALDRRMDAFKKAKIEVYAASVDSKFSHLAWRNTEVNKGGIGPVQYSLISDVKHNISRLYGVEHPEAGVAYRGAFLIDQNGVVRSQIINDLPIGRNIDEILRTFDAIQFHAEHGEVCPAGWNKGSEGMKENQDSVSKYLEANFEQL